MFSLASKHNDPNASLAWSERIGYGTGGFAFNMINGIIGSFLTIYFTSTVGLNAGIIATIFAISKVFDGISDVIVGRMVDRTKSKLGKGRSWLLRMCIPFGITTMLLFFVPQNFPEMAQYVYIFLMYNIVNAVCLTGMLVPYYSMISLMTANPYERGFLGNIQQIFQTLGNVVVNSTFVTLLGIFTSSTENIYTQRAFTITMLIYCIAMIVITIFSVFSTKERVHSAESAEEDTQKSASAGREAGTWETVKALFKNKYWIMMTGMLALFFLMYSVNGGATVYYAKDILGDKNLVSTINGIFNIVQICGMFFIAMLVKKFGKRNVFALGLVLDIVGMLVLNFSGGSMAIIVVSSVIRGIGNACGGATMWAMVSDTIDYGEWKTGCRTEGLVNSACSFGYKIGNGIGSALLGLILEIGGYVGTAAVQTESALTSIKVCFVWIPILVYACGLVIMKFYHLDKEFDGIIADLKARAQK